MKEFSTSRLKYQALHAKHRQATRGRRPGSAQGRPSPRKNEEAELKTGPWGHADEKKIDEDPLGLIRREIAIMKKLEYV